MRLSDVCVVDGDVVIVARLEYIKVEMIFD